MNNLFDFSNTVPHCFVHAREYKSNCLQILIFNENIELEFVALKYQLKVFLFYAR